MRILALTDFYPPIVGGLERHVQTASRELVRRGHDVCVVTLQHSGLPSFEDDDGVRVHRLPSASGRLLRRFYRSPDRHFHPTVPDPVLASHLRRLLSRERPDVVHAHGWIVYSFLALKRDLRPPLVVTLHDYSLVCVKKNYLHRGRMCSGPAFSKCVRCASEQYGAAKSLALTSGFRASWPLHDRVDRFIAVGGTVAEASRRASRGVAVEVVPSFIPDAAVERGIQEPRPAFLPPEDGFIMYAGGLERFKGIEVLMEAHRRLASPVPLVLLTAAHSAVLRPPKGVYTAIEVPHPQVMAAWRHCAIGAVPSIWPEPFGQVAVEVMASSRPVVASATGALPDIVADGETGLLVPPGDPGALAAALDSLLADPARRERMGAAGRERAMRFMASAVIDRIEAVYEQVLASASSRYTPASLPER